MKKVLVVDDEMVVCKTLKRALHMDGLPASFVLSANEAIDIMKKQIFNLVITDIKMPKINGIELIRIIKKKTPEMPILAISGFATDEMAAEACMNGAYEFIAKPFEVEDLLSLVKKGFNLT